MTGQFPQSAPPPMMVLLTLDVVYHGSGMMMLPMMMLPLPCVLCLHMKPPSKNAGSSVLCSGFTVTASLAGGGEGFDSEPTPLARCAAVKSHR